MQDDYKETKTVSTSKEIFRSVKTFCFEDEHLNLEIKITEILDGSHGLHVWPCAVVLAQYIWKNRRIIKGKHFLEIGAGTALPSIVAAKCGALITITDGDLFPECLDLSKKNILSNKIEKVNCLALTWGILSPQIEDIKPIDFIIGSDCFYEPKDFEDIIATISFLLKKFENAKFLTTYQERSSNWSIEELLEKWELKCIQIPLNTFEAEGLSLAGSSLPGRHTIQMLEITVAS